MKTKGKIVKIWSNLIRFEKNQNLGFSKHPISHTAMRAVQMQLHKIIVVTCLQF